MDVLDSILNSVKALLGLSPENTDLDQEIILNINAAISTLAQIGIGPTDGYMITSESETYEDYLGDEAKTMNLSDVKMYLFYKTKLGWDTPQSSSVIEVIKEMIQEIEWRLNVSCDSLDIFKEKGKEEISK